MWRALESETPPPAVDECLAQWRGRDGARALVRAVRALDSSATREIAADLEGLRHPTLVVWGAHDVYQSVASGRALSAAIPGSRFELAGGAGHFVPWDEPAELAGLIASFYRGIR
jgi:pimeloyl-ACP methyl ester carboxylesterase